MQVVSRAVNGLNCISVTRPGRGGNPYDVRVFGRELSMALFRETMSGCWHPSLAKDVSDELNDAAYTAHCAFIKCIGEHPAEAARTELRGHNLSCYCDPSDACHADVLL
jgi:hypothetical protein